jgi:hypothetical protein
MSDPDLLLSSTSDDRDGVALLSAYVPSLALADLAFGRERDAILACFPQGIDEPDAALAQRVAETARHLAAFAETTRAVQTPTESLELRCKFGVSMGELHRLILGVSDLWLHPLLVGENGRFGLNPLQ